MEKLPKNIDFTQKMGEMSHVFSSRSPKFESHDLNTE